MTPDSGLQINLIFIFFIYGLAFFSMGIALMLEAGRSPLLAEARILRPIAVFGLIHGAHEWLEIFILQAAWLEIQLPAYYLWLRLAMLVFSFISLIAFGIQVLRPPIKLTAMDAIVSFGMLALYIIVLTLSDTLPDGTGNAWAQRADVLARYLLAVPGAILAAFAIRAHSGRVNAANRQDLNLNLQLAAAGFAIYGLTQLVVTPTNLVLSRYLNATWFLDTFGIPIQTVRAGIAIVITYGLIRATQVTDKERQQQLVNAQKQRFEALERVKDELVKQEDLRRALLRHAVAAQEEERARISRELHDGTAQTLTALSVNLAALQNRLPDDPTLTELTHRLRDLSDQMARDLHRLVHDLRPAQLDDLGLSAALQFLTDEITKNVGLKISLQVEGTRSRLDSFAETALYRIAQEALTNVVRHAQTDCASVQLGFEENSVVLRVADQGKGFSFDGRARLPSGLGLAGMRERAESAGGQFSLHSTPGQGTTVAVRVPLESVTD